MKAIKLQVEKTIYLPQMDGRINEMVVPHSTMEFKIQRGVYGYFNDDGEWITDRNFPWILSTHGPQSLPLHDKHRDTIQEGWVCQSGTKPVFMDGKWGGRNYDQLRIPPAEMKRLWDWWDEIRAESPEFAGTTH